MNVEFANQEETEHPTDTGGKMPKQTTSPVNTTAQPVQPVKRGRGRPRKGEEVAPFVSLLPAPPKFEINKAEDFFKYIRSIPKESRVNRITLTFYRYYPCCDTTEGGTKNKCILIMEGEQEPFPFEAEDWELQILHLFGSGTYGCYLNEMNRTICRCLNIKTKWDLDNYPPVLDPATLLQDHPNNKAYIQWLRQKGITLPSEQQKNQEENEMQLAETISKLTDTVIAQSTRASIPVPPVPQQQSAAEKLTLEGAGAVIDMVKKNAEMGSNQSDPFKHIDGLVAIATAMRGDTKQDDSLKVMLQETMQTNRMLMEKMLTQQSKNGMDDFKNVLEVLKSTKEVFSSGDSKDRREDEEENPKRESIGETLVKAIPASLPYVVQLVDRGFAAFNMMRQPTPQQLQQQLQPVNQMTPAQMQAAVQQQAQNPQTTQTQTAQQTQTAEQPIHPINPNTGQPFTPEELAEQEQQRQRYMQFHGFLAPMSPAIVSHLNDVNKDGYDFAEWLISGYSRIAYDQIKAVGPEVLMGAIKSYGPLWQQIGGIEAKVQEFVNEFMTYDEFMAKQEDDEEGEK